MKNAVREYKDKHIDMEKLAGKIEEFFKNEKFKVQSATHLKGTIIQAQKTGLFRTIIAADQSLTVTITGTPDDLTIRIGVAAWLKDLGIAAVEGLLVTPLLLFIEVPESLWVFEVEHNLWKYIEEQINLGL
ncbi:MAG: hypothetical protein ACP5NO_08605 [Thermoplasmata archaeon]